MSLYNPSPGHRLLNERNGLLPPPCEERTSKLYTIRIFSSCLFESQTHLIPRPYDLVSGPGQKSLD